jgi:hypothetical protein
MTSIDFVSDTPTNHRFVFSVPKTLKDKLYGKFEKEIRENNLMMIDTYVAQFNEKTNGLVADYAYEMISDKEVDVAVLFKHMFKALKETQKYIKCNVKAIGENVIQITAKELNGLKLKTGTAELMPIKSVRVSYEIIGEIMTNTIHFETTDNLDKYPNFPMVEMFIKEGISESITAAEAAVV